ncbi:MAG: MFS transporter [Microbacterium sp.]
MTSPNQTSPRRAWIMLIVITMLNTAGMTVVLPVLPFVVLRYVPDQGSLAIWVGVLEAINAFCAFLAAPVLGALSDRVGRRPVIVIAAFGSAVGFAVFGVGGSIWILLLGRIIQGATAGDMPALFAYVADITPPEQRAKRFGLLGALSGIGFMVGPALGGLLAAIDLDLPVFITAGIALVVAILSFVMLPESLAPERRRNTFSFAELNPVKVIGGAFRRPSLRPLLLGFLLLGIPFAFFINNSGVLALDSVGWGATQLGVLTSIIGVLDIIIQGVLLGFLLPRMGERGLIIAGAAIQGLGCLALAVVAGLFAQPWLLVVGYLAFGGGQGAATAAMDGALSSSVGDDEQGWLAGASQAIQSAIGMLAPLVVGLIYATMGHSVPYWLGAAMFAAAIWVFARSGISSPSKRRAPEPVDA